MELSFAEMDAKLIELQKSRVPLKSEIDRIEVEIEFLESEKTDAENKLESIDIQMKIIAKKLYENKVKSLEVYTDDQFTNDIIRASYFCNREECGAVAYDYVNIADTEIIACTGFMLIKINSDCIPDYFKNTRIKWDTRSDFEQHINRKVKPIPSYKKILDEAEKTHRVVAEKIKASEFWDKVSEVSYSPETTFICAAVSFKIGDLKLTISKERLENVLMGMGDEEFTIRAYIDISPIILQGSRTMVIMMPIKPGV